MTESVSNIGCAQAEQTASVYDSADGLYEKRQGDWVFVDWSTHFDKDAGPLCAEQMLLCHAYACMAKSSYCM